MTITHEWIDDCEGIDRCVLISTEDAHALVEERDTALALADRRAGALRRIEWIPEPQTGGMRFCPDCEEWEGRGHAAGCELAAALAAAPPPAGEDAGGTH